ncbi:hypothetical protein A2U01_0109404, partial [Trifolium medium]|nr:hypothetical protein [Trifolium medium]
MFVATQARRRCDVVRAAQTLTHKSGGIE